MSLTFKHSILRLPLPSAPPQSASINVFDEVLKRLEMLKCTEVRTRAISYGTLPLGLCQPITSMGFRETTQWGRCCAEAEVVNLKKRIHVSVFHWSQSTGNLQRWGLSDLTEESTILESREPREPVSPWQFLNLLNEWPEGMAYTSIPLYQMRSNRSIYTKSDRNN